MKKPVIQTHHISYGSATEPEITVKIFKGEHWAITLLNRRKRVSKGFLEVLREFIKRHEAGALEL